MWLRVLITYLDHSHCAFNLLLCRTLVVMPEFPTRLTCENLIGCLVKWTPRISRCKASTSVGFEPKFSQRSSFFCVLSQVLRRSFNLKGMNNGILLTNFKYMHKKSMIEGMKWCMALFFLHLISNSISTIQVSKWVCSRITSRDLDFVPLDNI